MLHACTARFDVTGNLKNFVIFLELNKPLVPLFSQKILSFGPSFYKMQLNTMQTFLQKGGYSPFWILASRGSHKCNKFCILDGTKHDPENFGILYFIIPK